MNIRSCQKKFQGSFGGLDIREGRPASLHELARLAQRNIKNVSEDVKYLAQVGLIELEDSANRVSARVNYDKILLEIAV